MPLIAATTEGISTCEVFTETGYPTSLETIGEVFFDYKRLPGKGSALPGAWLRRRPKCSLTVQKRTLGAHILGWPPGTAWV